MSSCDHIRNIIAVTTGFIGAASDVLVKQHTDRCCRPHQFNSDGEYLLEDRGVCYTARVIGPQKGVAAGTSDDRDFDKQVAR